MTTPVPPRKQPATPQDSAAATPAGSGAGAGSALAAMLRKRRMHIDNAQEAQEPVRPADRPPAPSQPRPDPTRD